MNKIYICSSTSHSGHYHYLGQVSCNSELRIISEVISLIKKGVMDELDGQMDIHEYSPHSAQDRRCETGEMRFNVTGLFWGRVE